MKRALLPLVLSVALMSLTGVVAANAEVKTKFVDYRQGDVDLRGYLAYDDSFSGKRPGVLLVHDREGLTAKTFKDAEMIAKLGYVVLAADMYGKGVAPKTVPEMAALTGIYDADHPLMVSRSEAGFDVLRENPLVDSTKLALIGYCFGGTVALELAKAGVPIAGVVSVHGAFRNLSTAPASNIRGRVLILHGAEDKTAPLDSLFGFIGDLRTANVDWQLELYSGATHTFTTPSNPAEERADREYKGATEKFFKEIFGL